jgi:hypothetical protein
MALVRLSPGILVRPGISVIPASVGPLIVR